MSAEEKKNHVPDDDGLAKLVNSFGKKDRPDEDIDSIVLNGFGSSSAENSDSEVIEDSELFSSEDPEFSGDVSDNIEELQEVVSDAVVEKEYEEDVSEDVDLTEKNLNANSDENEQLKNKTKEKKNGKSNKTEKKSGVKAEHKLNKQRASKKDKSIKTEDFSKTSDYETVKHKKSVKTEDPKSGASGNTSPGRLVVVLTAICAAVAMLLAVVNYLTAARIAENNSKAMILSIQSIFDETVQVEQLSIQDESELTAVYLVIKDGGVCGYCAAVAPSGFGGTINLMVGIDSAGTVVGVEVVSMSETPGLGSKAGGDDFLSQFTGRTGDVSIGNEIDAISGATISSKAVVAGVNSVTTNLLDLSSLAAERGMSVIPFIPGSTVTETDIPETIPVTESPEAVVPEAPVTTEPTVTTGLLIAPEVSKDDVPPEIIVENPNDENPGIHADYEEDTVEYETLTTEPETTEVDSAEEDSEE